MYKIRREKPSFFLNVLKILRIDFCTVLLLLSIISSCKKEQTPVPVLTGEITFPQNGFNCTFGDTILVTGNISCDYPIQSAFLSLTDDNNNTIVPGVNIGSNSGNNFQFSTNFILDNPDALTGDYTLKISVRSNDQNIILNQYRIIHVIMIFNHYG